MYCIKCGKETGSDAMICPECDTTVKTVEVISEEKTSSPELKSTRWLGLGGAITATAIGLVSWVFVFVMLLGLATAAVGLMICVGLIALALALSSVAGGLEAVKLWDSTRREGKPAPIATCILSMVSFANATGVLLFLTVFTIIVI